jgi:hypothetical protein
MGYESPRRPEQSRKTLQIDVDELNFILVPRSTQIIFVLSDHKAEEIRLANHNIPFRFRFAHDGWISEEIIWDVYQIELNLSIILLERPNE